MIRFLAKIAGVIALLILFMVFLKNPLETSVGIAVMGGWIGLMFTPHFRREMKKGRTFKQICKEDVFVFNGSYQHKAFDNQLPSFSNNDVLDSPIGVERSSPGWLYNNHDSSIEGNLR